MSLKIGRKLKSVTALIGFTLLFFAGLFGQEGEEGYPFRPESEYQEMGTTAYKKFLDQEGIPVYTGWAANLYEIELAPWKRQGPGISGAYVFLEGTGGLIDNSVMEIPVEGKTKPEHHLFEEQILILRGEGEAHFWQKDPADKVVVRFKRGTVFAPPLNTWHQFINTGVQPVRLVSETDLPLKIDIFHNADFMFNSQYEFTDRYAGQSDYFDPENAKTYGPTPEHHSLSIVNLVRDAWTWRLFHAGQGFGDIDRHILMSNNVMPAHIEQFPTGTYERAHSHGPGAAIVLLDGNGYTLLWHASNGRSPWKDGKGDQVVRVDWKEGVLFVPPTRWFHQHFNTGQTPTRFIMLGSRPGNELYKMTAKEIFMREGEGSYMIMFHEQDPYVTGLFEEELAKHGAKSRMPAMNKLVALEKMTGEGEFLKEMPLEELEKLLEEAGQ
jgi:oxalate decarboxylase/phosphoglucose isomerase-like protein (cupin superfamily)